MSTLSRLRVALLSVTLVLRASIDSKPLTSFQTPDISELLGLLLKYVSTNG